MKPILINKSEYKLVINNFEGPLDLLIYLIGKNKMDIFEISLSELTDKYIEYLNEMANLDLEITSSFILMASTLLDLKSRKLLPELEPKEEVEETEESILARIIEYKKYKEISIKVKELYEENFGGFSKSMEKLNFNKNKAYEGEKINIDKLNKVYIELLFKNESKLNAKAMEVKKLALFEKITVKDKVNQIRGYLDKTNHIVFNDIFSLNQYTNIEVVTAFLGILELSKQKEVSLAQNELFSEIHVDKLY